MKKLKPYFDTLKLRPNQPDVFGLSVGMHILLPLFTFSIFNVMGKVSIPYNVALQALFSIAYIIYAVKNRKRMKTDYVAVRTSTFSLALQMSFMGGCFVLVVSDISIWELYSIMLASFIVGCLIAYIIAARYVSEKSNAMLPAIVAIIGIFGGSGYYFRRWLFTNFDKILMAILTFVYCSALAGGLAFIVIGKFYSNKNH